MRILIPALIAGGCVARTGFEERTHGTAACTGDACLQECEPPDICLLDNGADCGGNGDCINVCINGTCTDASGTDGPCDETADCVSNHSCGGTGTCTLDSGGSPSFVSVVTGLDHTCGLTARGTAFCWGSGVVGQLGNGGTPASVQSPQPVDTSLVIAGNRAFVEMSAGSGHTCGLAADGAISCCGWGFFGQLGNGGGFDAQSPTAVDASACSDARQPRNSRPAGCLPSRRAGHRAMSCCPGQACRRRRCPST